ncbi:MAG: glycosyltransferase family 4 protein [Candidatus Nitrosotenuis sp.]
MEKPSVLMVVARYPPTYGHTTVINNLCKGLSALGHRTAIGAFSFTSDPPANIQKVILNKFELLKKGADSLDFDIIHPHQARVLYYLLFRKTRKPVVLHYHAASNIIQELNLKLSMMLFKKRISKIICVSKKAQNHFDHWTGPSDAVVIYNGVDTNFYHPNLDKTYKKGSPQLLFVSVLRKYKRASDLVNAMPILLKKYPNAHLQIVGDGEEFSRLKELIKSKKLENSVEMTGRISDEELRYRYASCDIYVSASTNEHCPVPVFEAMACGKPLVLSKLESHEEILLASQAGMAFSNAEDFCDKVDRVFKDKNRYGHEAVSFAARHDWSHIAEQVADVYAKLI